jgi:hypothetical protein
MYADTNPPSSRDPFTFDMEFDWIGLGVNVGYWGCSLLPALDTVFRAILVGSYDLPGFDPASSAHAGRLVLRGSLEVDQGFLWNKREQANLLECFLACKTRFEQNFDDPVVEELTFASALPDCERLFQNSIIAGLEWKDIHRKHPHRVFSGMQAEISLEWGPLFLFNGDVGGADFLRFNCSFRGFLPLFDLDPDNPFNAFSAYAGLFAAVDYVCGTGVPLNIRQSFGGRSPRKGLGFALRGLEDGRLDTPLKAVANTEVRFNLPALADPSVIPGLLVFFDAGYYNLVDAPVSGFIFSTGAGVTLSLFDAVNLCFTTQLLLNHTKATGEIWTPVYFEFVWHF